MAKGRPPTKPGVLKDGYYLELMNKGSGAKSGIKIRRDTEAEMLDSAKDYNKTKDVVILGECKNGKFVNKSKRL